MAQLQYQPITPSDTVPQPGLVTAILVGGAGNVAIQGPGDSAAVTLTNLAAGATVTLPHPVLFVMATNTTATGLVGALATSQRPVSGAT